ncbi:hypothetical protein BC792_11042 [Sphingobacterium allocomposti]|uniref:Uncharacterized protein n=1 Tax=Sphingobacterium allocomposti TaxID=415956 RepID=A0A5S5DJ57_9SPHI|nr:hypothetical protein [Sphingobacterium composti Yoo et al. 2007 non Ten et al. 2007]TYP95715.1 hypothetical protein BC792_11042 [Sphingobacterium composti Yoo et al. 2007 non Ten et al. 2007]
MFDDNRYFALASSQLFPTYETLPCPISIDDGALVLAEAAYNHYLQGALHAALADYSEGIKRYPEQPFFYACRSLVNELLEDTEGAFYDYQVAKKLDFNFHTFLEWIEEGGGRPDKTIKGFTDVNAVLTAALEATQDFDYKYAIALYTYAIREFSVRPDIYVYRGVLYMYLLRYDLALDDFNVVLDDAPAHFQALLSRGKLYEAIREDEHALADFNNAIATEPGISVGYEERGSFFCRKKAYAEALKDYTTLVTLSPDDFYVYTLRADLLEQMECWEDALNDYSKAITLNPYYSDLYNYRAHIKEKLGDEDGAAEDRKLYIEIENED